MKKILSLALCLIVNIFWTQNTNLAIQQVGIAFQADKSTETVGFFLQQALVGQSDRQKLRIIPASSEDMTLLGVKKLSALVLLTLRKTNEQATIDLTFIDSKGTNSMPTSASLPLSSWMKQVGQVESLLYTTISQRYPPKPITELKTIEIVKTYSPYEVRGYSVAMGGGLGYSGATVNFGKTYNNMKERPQKDTVAGFAFNLFLLWRSGLWYTEWQIHGLFPDDTSLLAEADIGYGLFGGIVSPLVGGIISYTEHFYELTNSTNSERATLEFSVVHAIPLVGVRVSFQPNFWLTLTAGGLPQGLLPPLWAEKMPSSFDFGGGYIRIQTSLQWQKSILFFLSWKMWDLFLDGRRETPYPIDEKWSIEYINNSSASVTIGGAYGF